MKKYKTKLSREALTAVVNMISTYIILGNCEEQDYQDMLLMSVLIDLHKDLQARLADGFQRDFKITLNATKSLALLTLLIDVVAESSTTYWWSVAHKMRNELLQLFPLKIGMYGA